MNTIKITDEQLEALNKGESITISPPEPEVIELKNLSYRFNGFGVVFKDSSDTRAANTGLTRNSEQATKLANERMLRVNRLSALAHQLGGELEPSCHEDKWGVYKNSDGVWSTTLYGNFAAFQEIVYMTQKCAEEICEILNKGRFKL